MDNTEFHDRLLKDKEDEFKKYVKLASHSLNVSPPPVIFWDTECPEATGKEWAHIHLDTGIVCVSRIKLRRMTREDIKEAATHEVTHLIKPDHSSGFYIKHDVVKQSVWTPPGGVVVITGGQKEKENKRKIKVDKTRCNYHLCRKKTRSLRCKFCKGFFCKEHLLPKQPGIVKLSSSDIYDIQFSEEWKKTDGHPCPPFVDYSTKERKKADEKYKEALDRLTRKGTRREIEIYYKPKEEFKEEKEEIKIPEKIDVHEVLVAFFNIELNEFISKFDKLKIIDVVQTGGLQEITEIEQHPFKPVVDILKEFREKLFSVTSPLRHKIDIDLFFDYFKPFIHFYVRLSIKRNMFNNPEINEDFDTYFLKPCERLFNKLNKRFNTTRFTDEIRNTFNSIPNLTVRIVGEDLSFISNKTIYVLEYNIPELKEYSKRRLFAVFNTNDKGYAFFKLPYGVYDVYAENFDKKIEIIQNGDKDKEAKFKISLFGRIKPVISKIISRKPTKEEYAEGDKHREVKKSYKKWWIIILLVILLVFLVKDNFFPSVPLSCDDGTLHGSCSVNRPFFCNNGNLIQNISLCGCPEGERAYNNECIKIIKCIDGTLHPECSVDKPYQCLNGNLILKASVCGCLEGYYTEGNYCKKEQG